MLSLLRVLARLRSKRSSSLRLASARTRSRISSTSSRAYQRSRVRIPANPCIASRYDRPTSRLTAARRLLVEAAIAAGDREARREPLDVPVERPGVRLVEVVDAEHEPSVGRGEGAEVREVRVAAELDVEPAARRRVEIGGHQVGGAAVEGERRDEHPAVADRHQLRDAGRGLLLQHRDGVAAVRCGGPLAVRAARDRLARRAADGGALLHRRVRCDASSRSCGLCRGGHSGLSSQRRRQLPVRERGPHHPIGMTTRAGRARRVQRA